MTLEEAKERIWIEVCEAMKQGVDKFFASGVNLWPEMQAQGCDHETYVRAMEEVVEELESE